MLLLGRLFKPSLMLLSNARSFPKRGETESCSTWVDSLPCPQTFDWAESLVKDIHSSLLGELVNYGPKKLYSIGPLVAAAASYVANLV